MRAPLETATPRTATKGEKVAQTKGPRGGWGAESASLRGPATGGDTAEGPLWEGRGGRRLRPATPWLHGPPPAPLPPYPGPDRDPQPSRDRRCCARAGGAHFPKFGELTQVVAASSGSTALSPGNPTWSLAAWLQPEPSAPGEGGGGGSGPDSEGRKCRRGASRDL